MFQRVLVALDSSAQAPVVAGILAQLNLTDQSHVVLTHIMALADQSHDVTQSLPTMDIDSGQAEQYLLSYQRRLPCPSHIEIAQGEPVQEIIRLAKIHRSDLIVLGSRGLTGLNRILQGSVSSQVLAESPCSVLVVKTAPD
ncbi:MAG: universal stress protein [Cyanobacteria bacterium]|nr:universal stress protein [Cyanobacteriota bacterium]MDA0867558.1 universal stress protein [Cyanobacteriota bacterium]